MAPSEGEREGRTGRVLAVVMALVGAGAVAVALLGPLGVGAIEYHVSEGAAQQVRGGDVAGLLLVGPLAWASAWLVQRGQPGGPSLALAPASYGLYTYSQLALAGDPLRYGGTSERYFPLFWAMTTLSGTAVVLAGVRLARAPAPPHPRRLVRVTGGYLLAVAAFLTFGLHLPGLLDAWRAAPTSAEYLADPGLFWVVKVMDLAVVVPVAVGVGLGLLTHRDWAVRLLAPVTGWCALLAASVAGMALSMLATGAPGASAPLAAGVGGVALAATALAVAAYGVLLRSTPTSVGVRPTAPPAGLTGM